MTRLSKGRLGVEQINGPSQTQYLYVRLLKFFKGLLKTGEERKKLKYYRYHYEDFG